MSPKNKITALCTIFCAALPALSLAGPIAITAMKQGALSYSFFFLDTLKLGKQGITATQEMIKLTDQLAPYGIKPCQIATDLNGTGVACGDATNGLMQFGTNEFFTYNAGGTLPGVPIPKNQLDNGVTKRYGSDFLAPTVVGTPATPGNAVQIHFTHRVAQFGLLLDSPNGAVGGVQFIVDRVALPVEPISPNTPRFVGVEDPHGFTDVVIVPSGGSSQSWVADQFSFLPMTAF